MKSETGLRAESLDDLSTQSALPKRFQPDEELAYSQLIRRVRDVIRCFIPQNAAVLVIGEGDDDFLSFLPRRRSSHFPLDANGSYAGRPENGHIAATALEAMRARGFDYLVIPATSMGWLERYPELTSHLKVNGRRIVAEPGTCIVYSLGTVETHRRGEVDYEPQSSDLQPIRDIAAGDPAYRVDPDNYFHWGWHGLRTVEQALQAARKHDVKTILDFPSGYGRVLRMLKARFPDAFITACDIDRDGVDFCAEVLGAKPAYSEPNPRDVVLPDHYDVIWCGSLLTHLPAELWTGFIELFSAHLRIGGVLVFTTHGRYYAELLRRRDRDFGIPDVDRLLTDFDEQAFAHQDQPNRIPNYGFSLSSPSWVCKELEQHHPSLRLVLYAERGWGAHQDAIACVRAPDDEI